MNFEVNGECGKFSANAFLKRVQELARPLSKQDLFNSALDFNLVSRC